MEAKEENLLWKEAEYGCFTIRVKKITNKVMQLIGNSQHRDLSREGQDSSLKSLLLY